MINRLTNTLSRLTTAFIALVVSSYAYSQPVANFTANNTTGCTPFAVQFTDQSTGSPFSWAWDFGNGQISTAQNPSVWYNLPGTYTVRLVVRNAAGIDEEIKTGYITVNPGPTASFTSNLTTACVPATVQFTDQSTVPAGGGSIVSWLWNFGDGNTSNQQNPTHVYTSTGFYTVSLQVTTSTGCQATTAIGRYIRVVDGIDANFIFSQPGRCQAPFIVNFTDQSAAPGTLSYSWNFGNGDPPSTAQNPTATYNAPGTYTVTLTVQSSLGCSGTISKDITITGKTTDFTVPAAAVCVGQTVTFQNTSSPPPVSSSWDFGDGTFSSQVNAMKIYTAPGTYQVKLVNDYGNCSDSITKPITVVNQPVVSFTANDSTSCTAPFTVQFTDNSGIAVPGATWLWDFGDGNTSGQQNPSHTYTGFGVYTVTLTISLPSGCQSSFIKPQYIRVQQTTVSIANAPDGGCIPFSYSPIASIQTVDPIVSYAWDLGEPGATYSVPNPTHVYTSAGNFNLTLTVTTQSGCTGTVTIPNGVRTGVQPNVNFSFVPNNACASTPVQFTDLSTTTPGAFVTWQWNFGDGQGSSEQNPLHKYADTGTLIVQLIVTNNGCPDTLTQPIQILPPVAIFDHTVNCSNRLQVTFINQSLTDPAYGPITYEWRMGDPANTVFFGLPAPTFTYPAYGTYNARLIVTNGACSYDTTMPVTLTNSPVSFTASPNPVCRNAPFTLTAVAGNPANITSYEWIIGTTTITTSTGSVTHSIATAGSYDVTLTITDINGCTSTTTVPNFITVRGPVPAFSINNGGGCANKQVTFNDLTTPAGTIAQWTWDFGDGNRQTFNAPPFTHTYAQTGSYSVKLIVRDNANCTDSITMPNIALITKPQAGFRVDTFYCPLAPLQFTDTSFGAGLTYEWSFGDGGTSTLQNPTHTYALGNNSYDIKLKIRDMVGCEDSVIKLQHVDIRSPQAAFTMVDSTAVCLPLVTSFTFQGSDYERYEWDFGDGGTSTAQNPSHFYNFYGTYIPKLYVYGPGGCVDSAQGTVIAYNPADIPITFTPATACNSAQVTFNFTPPPNFRFKFRFGDGAIDSSQQTTLTHLYTTPGVYYPGVTVYDRFGCEANQSIGSVTIYGAIPLFSQDKKEFCDQGEVFFTNYTVSNDPVTSSVWNFGDGNTSTVKDPSHVYSGAGTYFVRLTVTTQNNCVSEFMDTVRVYPTPVLSLAAPDTICINSTQQLQGFIAQPDSTIRWRWAFGNGDTSILQNPSVRYTTPGDYSVRLIASNKLGCGDTADHSINVVALPTATPVTDPLTVISGASVQINMNYSPPVISYNWTPAQRLSCTNCPSPVANPQFTTRYQVEIQDRYGCRNTGNITVQVICTGQNFFVPNTFSPNGDGSNDMFYPRGTGLFNIRTLRIFNRWGEVVFEKRELPVNNPAFGWDGRFKGKNAQADVYVYQLEIVCANGEILKYSGNVALIL